MKNEQINVSYASVSPHFEKWEKIKDLIDQNIDIMLNYRQSGHPGGSRSKVHALIVLLLSGVFRWDIRRPEHRFGDRFILSAGHTVPLIYAAFAVFNEALRTKYQQTKNQKYFIPENRGVYWEDLAGLRHVGGLSGHAEMSGKSLFLKWNTGPSGHGLPASVGEAFALKYSKSTGVKVCALEGEGGLTPGASHESKNSAWGLGLDNLFYLVDWNDYGIDNRPTSSVVAGTPADWFKPYGWNVYECEDGTSWEKLAGEMIKMFTDKPGGNPRVLWFKTRKGRGYGIYDNKAHGKPHDMNSPTFWDTKKEFAEKYGTDFYRFGKPAPESAEHIRNECLENLKVVADVLKKDQDLVDYLADTLVSLGSSIPEEISNFNLRSDKNILEDAILYDYEKYPSELYVKPGEVSSNRNALANFGAWINSYCAKKYSRPLFLACSADLADSTNISGFAASWKNIQGYGWYERNSNTQGTVLPQEITEFTNAGIAASIASVNFSKDPYNNFIGFYGACSTYGSFSYLKYGEMRLFSQLVQDCEIKTGKVLWIAGHSGPETAEDARTHFGIFAPGVTQLFPDGKVVNLYPWEHNEVPVLLGTALSLDFPIIALHLTRPSVVVPDRKSLGIGHYFEASKGAYLIRDYQKGVSPQGTLIVQGTIATANVIKILPELAKAKLNVKIVAAVSPELFKLAPKKWRDYVLPEKDWIDSTVISTMARRTMCDWIYSKVSSDYAITSDWDNNWRTGGTVDEIAEEAKLSPDSILNGIELFAKEREKRLKRFLQI